MANEAAYGYAGPGGTMVRQRSAHLTRYRSPSEITGLEGYLTVGDFNSLMQAAKDNALAIGLTGLGLFGLWWMSRR